MTIEAEDDQNRVHYTVVGAEKALEYFNANREGPDYELLHAYASVPIISKEKFWVVEKVELNFFAKPKGAPFVSAEFFYAATEPDNDDPNNDIDRVVECCILTPPPFTLDSVPEVGDPSALLIYHPDHVHCDRCVESFERLDSDSD